MRIPVHQPSKYENQIVLGYRSGPSHHNHRSSAFSLLDLKETQSTVERVEEVFGQDSISIPNLNILRWNTISADILHYPLSRSFEEDPTMRDTIN